MLIHLPCALNLLTLQLTCLNGLLYVILFSMAQQPAVGQGLPIIEVS